MISSHKTNHEASYILHSRAYRDNSLLLDIFSREHGRFSAIAKGAKQPKSKFHGLLQPFGLLFLSWSGRGELMTLTDAEAQSRVINLKGQSLLSGFYVNELLTRLLQRHDPHQSLFDVYHETLHVLSQGEHDEPVLRRFEYHLLLETGYGLILDHDVETGEIVQADAQYCYHIEHGPVRAQEGDDGLLIDGSTLLDLHKETLHGTSQLKQAKQLMRAIIAHQLGDKPLKTRELALQKVL